MNERRNDPLERALQSLADEQWVDPPSTALLLERVVHDERRRAARTLWIVGPALLLLGACVTLGALHGAERFAANVELKIDGRAVGVHAVDVEVIDGEIQPVQIDVDGYGNVEVKLEAPGDLQPAALDGMRVEVWMTSDPEEGGN